MTPPRVRTQRQRAADAVVRIAALFDEMADARIRLREAVDEAQNEPPEGMADGTLIDGHSAVDNEWTDARKLEEVLGIAALRVEWCRGQLTMQDPPKRSR